MKFTTFFDTFWNLARSGFEAGMCCYISEVNVSTSKGECEIPLGQNVPFENATYLLKLQSISNDNCATTSVELRSISVALVFESNLFDDDDDVTDDDDNNL